MTAARTAGDIETALRSLFPAEVATAVELIDRAGKADLWPEERMAIAGVVPHRLAEFCAGRMAARRALAVLGHRPVAVPMGEDRAPIWPVGISGSIAHAGGIAVAVARRGGAIGVDVETDAPLDPELWPIICTPAELSRLSDHERGRLAKRVFSAKEAVFKAQEAGHRVMFGFDAVSVTLAADGFVAQFLDHARAHRVGQVIHGRLISHDGLILAGVAR